VELQGRATDMKREGLSIVAVSYDPVPVLAEFSSRMTIGFPLLSDPGSKTIKAYGILNTTLDSANPTYGIPFPGTFVLDARGVVTSRFFETAYQERDTISSILVKRGGRIDAPATEQTTPHLTITSFTTDRVATPGTHFSLVLDITPSPRVHVYAPGVSGYKPIALNVRPRPGLVIRSARFPAAEDYFFAPLNEHVAVYQKPFRLVQDVMIDPSPQGTAIKDLTSLTIAATLDYQACDDKICFVPQSVPMSWTVSLVPLDRIRTKRP
jgi:AhpC/TSA family/Disulphide bond corrector protein DsbC